MYCKDCLSFGVCRYASGSRLLEREPCADFMDIDKWVKLPCKAGDAVYQFDNAGRIYESVVTKIIYDTPIISFDKNAIGVSVFLTREEAERVLKETVGDKDV